MGKSSGGSSTTPVYQMPTSAAPLYEGPSKAEREARINALKQQWSKEALLDKQIEKFDVKQQQMKDTKKDLEKRKGVEEVLSNHQVGFKRKHIPKDPYTKPKSILNPNDEDGLLGGSFV